MLTIEQLTYLIIEAAIEVHRQLGPGLLESVYERCFKYELELRGLKVTRQHPVPILYKGMRLGSDLIMDLVVNDLVIIEVKATSENNSIFQAQLLTYLRLSKLRHGLIINFGMHKLTDGVQSVINGY